MISMGVQNVIGGNDTVFHLHFLMMENICGVYLMFTIRAMSLKDLRLLLKN